ncbi:MAG: efflux RND transporter periplasmic adaptor subunit [Bacteroidales bacterium]|nr:efflux RND transporter periplasmic adaptor subunit [Bacteroidales bacterium]
MNLTNKISKYGKITGLIIVSVIIGLIIGYYSGGGHTDQSEAGKQDEVESIPSAEEYTCSMHPQIRQDKPGLCPICAMDLIPVSTQEAEQDADPNEISLSKAAMELANIQTARVRKGIPEKSIRLMGKVKPDERRIARVTARFGGRIEELFINYTGQQVEKGQKLGAIYSPDLITAQGELLEAVKLRETNPSFYQAARNKLKQWELTDEQISRIEASESPVLTFEILAPISGTVMKRNVSVGDYVKEGSILYEVIDLSKVWVMFEAYERDLPWINTGDKLDFTLQSVPGEKFSSKVSYIDPFIDPSSRIARVRVEVNNSGLKLKPEMFANGVLESQITDQAGYLLIPRTAVLWTGERAIVYLKVPDREKPSFIQREIILGPEAGNDYVVASGLEEGEEIAMNGVFKIDAAAQLAGKVSMMNPEGGKVSTGHDHGSMDMGSSADMSSPDQHADHGITAQHAMVRVYGACGMCKSRIEETAMEQNGVMSASWDLESGMLHLDLDADKISVDEVEKAIAAVGHDTENHRAPDDVYEALPGCCLYDRPE